MEDLLLTNGRFVMGERVEEGALSIQNGRIARFYSGYREMNDTPARTVDLNGALAGPGFIDLHVHGGGGADVMEASSEAFRTLSMMHAQKGTTRLLLTTVTASHEKLVAVCRAFKAWRPEEMAGARPLGIHLEGPYIARAKKGAQNEAYIRPFSEAEFGVYQKESGGAIKLITLAPEKLPDLSVIGKLAAQGVVVSIGHTEATYEETAEAFARGARHVTHLCNAMPGVHHRSPGPITFALNQDGISVELIADGIHVHPAVIRLALRAKHRDEVAVVTDAISAAGMGDGCYELGGLPVRVEGGKAVLENGSLAGSCLDMEQAFRVLTNTLNLEPADVFRMMSTVPAKILGVDDRFGSLEPGKVADLVIMREGSVSAVMVEGRWVKTEANAGE